MNIHEDFAEFLRLLNDAHVEYVIVGGYAVAFYGYVRVTKDLDILFHNTPDNVARLKQALIGFGFQAASLEDVAFAEEGKIIRIGVAPVMIELLNSVSGIDFESIWSNRQAGQYGAIPTFYIALGDLIINKQAAGRPQDAADVAELRSVRGQSD